MRAVPLLLLVFRGLRGLGGRRGGRRGLKTQVGHLGQRERHLPGVSHGALPEAPVAPGAALVVGRGASVQRAPVGGAPALLFGVAVDVGPRLRQGGHGVQGEAGGALVGGGVGHLGVAAAALEAGPQVLAGRAAGVRGRPVADVQQGGAAVSVRGEALRHRGASLWDGGVVRGRRDGGVALGDRGVALRCR